MNQIFDYLVRVPPVLIGLFLLVIGIARHIKLSGMQVELNPEGKSRYVIFVIGLILILIGVIPSINAITYPGLPKDATNIERKGEIVYFKISDIEGDALCKEKAFGHFYFKNNTSDEMQVFTNASEYNSHGLQMQNTIEIFPDEGKYIYRLQSGKHTARITALKKDVNGNLSNEIYKDEQINVIPCMVGFDNINKKSSN
jgi:hypothetical protein